MILKGKDGAAVSYPPIKLIELWQTRPNKLIVNPHNGRAIGSRRKKKGRSLSSSSDSNDTAVMLKLMRQQQKMTLQNTILQMQERAVEQQHLQQSRYPHTNEVYSISQPFSHLSVISRLSLLIRLQQQERVIILLPLVVLVLSVEMERLTRVPLHECSWGS